MLVLDLYRVFEDKGIENPHRFLNKNGFTVHTTFKLLNNKVGSISFRHMEQLCLLLNCLPDDLFSWKSVEVTGNYNHPVLMKLDRGERKGNITSQLKSLSPDKLNEVRKYIDQISKTEE